MPARPQRESAAAMQRSAPLYRHSQALEAPPRPPGAPPFPPRPAQRPLTSAIALSVGDDGTRRYEPVQWPDVIFGTELAPFLDSEIWQAPLSPVETPRHGNSATPGIVEQCPVCLEELLEGCFVSRFPCRHVLHFECACTWLSSRICAGNSGTCPLCNCVVCTPVFAGPASHPPATPHCLRQLLARICK